MKNAPREVDMVIVSDVHLGTFGCQANSLLQYLKSVKPKHLVLNGDFFDVWQFSKYYWPKSHMKVVKHITGLLAEGIPVTYITGNHDEMLRKFAGFTLGKLQIVNHASFVFGGKSVWVFHGDIFDVTMKHTKWIAKIGADSYGFLILLNRLINKCLRCVGVKPLSLSKKIKQSVKNAVKTKRNYQQAAANLAASHGYQQVVCGHIHQADILDIQTSEGVVTYLNSGDWVESLTALEFHNGQWSLYKHAPEMAVATVENQEQEEALWSNHQLFSHLVQELQLSQI